MEQTQSKRAQLRILNSLTKQKDVFKPNHPDENTVNWYMCGPTVYADSHMGHARTYICFDILKKIMTDYFGYNVNLCMNITDIEDKIINKANQSGQKFEDLSRHFENEFFDDMKALNVSLPHVITRVSEFVPEIVDYIQKIIDNGYAYESNGSVYFDLKSYKGSGKHTYGKLKPEAVKDEALLLEGEGVLSTQDENFKTEKKDQFDFVLWKNSKPGEPSWDSPWGKGRPGWHIECSAMCGAVFKQSNVDIHSGGWDLMFPHHENEIAQSEGYYENDKWVNYWIHTGHLNIQGLKMSKSLKNFITIKEILQLHTPRQIRMMFLLQQYQSIMNYSTEDSLPQAVAKEKAYTNFFNATSAIIKVANIKNTIQKWNDKDRELSNMLNKQKLAVHNALADNFDTPQAIRELDELVTLTNQYISQEPEHIKIPLLLQVTKFVYHIMKCFGMYDEDLIPGTQSGSSGQAEEKLSELMNSLNKFRSDIKDVAKEGPKDIFRVCDELRDDILPYQGIQLEDRGTGKASLWRFEDKEKLLAERQAKIDEKKKKEEEKRLKKLEEDKKKSTPPSEYFKVYMSDKYTQFNEDGFPTHIPATDKDKKKNPDMVDKELPDAIKNKAQKEWNKQEEVYKKWMQEKAKQEGEEKKE